MYDRALTGKEKALGLEHIFTLDTVDCLGAVYVRHADVEKMIRRVLDVEPSTRLATSGIYLLVKGVSW